MERLVGLMMISVIIVFLIVSLIFNTVSDQWGAYNYDSSLDQLRFDLHPYRGLEMKERLTFEITESNLHFHWEYLQFDIPFRID